MRRIFWITLIGTALAGLGCVPTLHPLFTEDDLVFDARIIGAWADEDEDTWAFEKSSGQGYLLTLTEPKGSDTFDAHLLQLGAHQFLDLYPRTENLDDTFYDSHLVPVHTFYKVIFEAATLQLVAMNPDWLEERIENGDVEVAHVWREGDLLLTAPTEELQELVLAFADDPAAFPVGDTESLVIELERTTL